MRLELFDDFKENIRDDIVEPADFQTLFGVQRSAKSLHKKKKKTKQQRVRLFVTLWAILAGLSIATILFTLFTMRYNSKQLEAEMDTLRALKETNPSPAELTVINTVEVSAESSSIPLSEPIILPEYLSLYEANQDFIGWLTIDGTIIDYPVMQSMYDEDYYLKRNFFKEPDANGCLLADTDSVIGVGSKETDYYYLRNGTTFQTKPSTNLIIHGHTMQSGDMFGNLKLYKDEDYFKQHRYIKFDSLYEHREYEILCVFNSQVYQKKDAVFKYYNFFEAYNEADFLNWYYGIQKLALYDTGVTAEFGDEFITLSCCAYHTKSGRFVVVGKRIL